MLDYNFAECYMPGEWRDTLLVSLLSSVSCQNSSLNCDKLLSILGYYVRDIPRVDIRVDSLVCYVHMPDDFEVVLSDKTVRLPCASSARMPSQMVTCSFVAPKLCK